MSEQPRALSTIRPHKALGNRGNKTADTCVHTCIMSKYLYLAGHYLSISAKFNLSNLASVKVKPDNNNNCKSAKKINKLQKMKRN